MPKPPKAILFGAIGTLVETSEMQRASFNAAFSDAGLDWTWGRAEYADMLTAPGGKARIAAYGAARGEAVDADALHAAKVVHFRRRATAEGLPLRPGVAGVISAAKAAGVALGFATSTGRDTVDLVFEAVGAALDRADFAFVGDRSRVPQGKPAPDIYRLAAAELGLAPDEMLAIEDTPESARAARAAGIACVAVPGALVDAGRFPAEVRVIDRLAPALLGLRAADAA